MVNNADPIAPRPAKHSRRCLTPAARAWIVLTCVAVGATAAVPASAQARRTTQIPPPVMAAANSSVKSLVTTASANSRIATVLPARTTNSRLGWNFTMTVWDTAEGRYVYTKRDNISLRGASTAKLFTAAAALATLGAQHRMPTTVLRGLPGEVVLRAGGDPLLTSADLRSLASMTATALRAGETSADYTPSPSAPSPSAASPSAASPSTTSASNPSTGAIPTYSAATASASTSSPEQSASPRQTPTPSAMQDGLTSGAPTATTSEPISAQSSPAQSSPAQSSPARSISAKSISAKSISAKSMSVVVRADDSLFPGYGQSRGWPNSYLPWQVRPVNAFARDDNKVRDATADAGRFFARALASYGIQARYGGEAVAPVGAPTLATFAGHTVGSAVRRALLVSDNDTAEMLFRQVALATGRTADWDGARTATREVLANMGIPMSGVTIVDGSGLSLQNRLTAESLTAVLAQALTREQLSGLRSWLPIAGRSGTLSRSEGRFSTGPAKCAVGQISAKTGTLADAIALAGYATGADGTTKIVVAIVNSRPTRYSRLTIRRAVDNAVSAVTGCW